jgi:hypothetical protein
VLLLSPPVPLLPPPLDGGPVPVVVVGTSVLLLEVELEVEMLLDESVLLVEGGLGGPMHGVASVTHGASPSA